MSPRVRVLLALCGAAISTQACELLVDAEGLDIAEASAPATGVGAGALAEGAGTLRMLAAEEIPLSRAGPLRGVLEAGSVETAEGRAAATITAKGDIVARGRTWGRVASNGDVLMRSSAAASEVLVGQVSDGMVWAPDGGGNVVPIARIRGSLEIPTYDLKSGVRGTGTGIRLEGQTPVDVLRIRDGWYEVRPAETSSTGWIEAASLAVVLVPADGLASVAGAILTCVRYDSVTGRSRGALRDSSVSRTNVLSPLNASLSGRHVILRYPPTSTSAADSMALILKRVGAQVVRQEIDVPATQSCGGDIYYHRDDFRAARELQGLLSDVDRLRLSSFEIDEARFLIWLR